MDERTRLLRIPARTTVLELARDQSRRLVTRRQRCLEGLSRIRRPDNNRTGNWSQGAMEQPWKRWKPWVDGCGSRCAKKTAVSQKSADSFCGDGLRATGSFASKSKPKQRKREHESQSKERLSPRKQTRFLLRRGEAEIWPSAGFPTLHRSPLKPSSFGSVSFLSRTTRPPARGGAFLGAKHRDLLPLFGVMSRRICGVSVERGWAWRWSGARVCGANLELASKTGERRTSYSVRGG
jgi:hypothetical protein